MNRCYCCGKELNETAKPEHIIPNGIGGKLKSRTILCDDCNNKLSYLDESICKSLIHLTNLLNPQRDNGINPKIKVCSDNKTFIREANGKFYTEPEFQNVKMSEKSLSFRFKTTYSIDDHNAQSNALKPVFKLVEKFYKNNPNKIEKAKQDIIKKIEESVEVKDAPVFHWQSAINQDELLFLAMLKIAIGFYIYNNFPIKYIVNSINILKNKDYKSAEEQGNYFYPTNLFLTDSIYHLIYLKGDSENKLIYCIISLYGCVNTIILLNDNYTGKDFLKTYLYDLRNNKEKVFNNNILITKEMLSSITDFNNIEHVQNGICEQINMFLKFLVKREPKTDKFLNIIESVFQQICKLNLLSKEEYMRSFKITLEKELKKDYDFMLFLDNWIEDLSNIALQEAYTYEKYISTYIPQIVSNIATNSILKSITTNPSQVLDISSYKRIVHNSISHINTGNTLVDNYIKEQQNDIFYDLDKIIEREIYPKIKIYSSWYK